MYAEVLYHVYFTWCVTNQQVFRNQTFKIFPEYLSKEKKLEFYNGIDNQTMLP